MEIESGNESDESQQHIQMNEQLSNDNLKYLSKQNKMNRKEHSESEEDSQDKKTKKPQNINQTREGRQLS